MANTMEKLYEDLKSLCAIDDTFFYKDIRFHSMTYRIFNYRLCSYAAFQSRSAALNCRGTMFNITNPKQIELVSLPPEKFFNYHEGFGRQQYHRRGRFGDKMEKMDGSLMSTFLHRTNGKEVEVRLKSKLSLTSKQVLDATQLVIGHFKDEIERLARSNYTISMEYTSPSNHVYVSYAESRLTILAIRSHFDGQTFFGTKLKRFLHENNYPTLVEHLVPFELVPPHVTHDQLLKEIHDEPIGEGYVVEIIHDDQTSYLVKIKTYKYLSLHRDGQDPNSTRSLFEAVINEEADDLRVLFQDDPITLQRIDDMEQHVRPKYNRMIRTIEEFYEKNKHRSKREYTRLIKTTPNIEIYTTLLLNLYTDEQNDYKGFAMRHARDIFEIPNDDQTMVTAAEE